MRKISFKMLALLAGIAIVSFTSCNNDNEENEDENVKLKDACLITTTVKNPDGISGSTYLQLVESTAGKVDNSSAKQVNFAVGVGVRGKSIFSFPSFGKDGGANLDKFTFNGTSDLGNAQSLELPQFSGVGNIVTVDNEKAYLPSYTTSKVLVVNYKTMKKTGVIDLSKFNHKDNSAEPANGIIRDGFYYLCLNQVGGNWMPYPDYRQSDVVIIDVKTDKVVKIISEKTSKLSFPTRPMDYTNGMIFKTEQNDIYIACTGSFGFDPTYLNTGFICIPAGKQEFDTSRSWDVSSTLIEGTTYKPTSVLNTLYVGGGKLVAFVSVKELVDTSNPYNSRNAIAVLVDLNAKTIKKIEGIPATDGHSIPIGKFKDNKVVIGAYGKSKAGFFTYNYTSGEVKLLLSTVGNPTTFNYIK